MPSTLQLQLQFDRKTVSKKNNKNDDGFQNLLGDRERFVDASTRKSRDLGKEAFLSSGIRQAYYICCTFQGETKEKIEIEKKEKEEEEEKEAEEEEEEEEEDEEEEEEARRKRSKPVQFQNGIEWLV
uniref:Uncharacterized protein n=1 Tax=Vespula pensylvanica TaxID=30213 RepID=A0A834UF49_VESPE|nr:hypothetical protein H0235_003332 [Vespula pensylvanica]